MEPNSLNKFGLVEQNVKVGQGQQMTLLLRMNPGVRLCQMSSHKIFESLRNGPKCSG